MRKRMKTFGMITRSTIVFLPAMALMMLLPFFVTSALGQDYTAVVASVDYPEGCLRIRSGPSTSAPIIGCADLGSRVRLTGIWSGNWAEISRPMVGWVYGPQLATESFPPVAVGPVVVTPPLVDYWPFPFLRYPYRRHRYWEKPRHRVYRGMRRGYRHRSHAYQHFPKPQRSYRIRRPRTIHGPRIFRAHNAGPHRISRPFRSHAAGFRSGRARAGHGGFGGRRGGRRR